MSLSHTQVCHVWASANKESAKGFNIYFEGPRLYSYGTHYLLGYRLAPATFFLNSTSYSISTSKHQSYASRATHGRMYWIPNLTAYRYELDTLAKFGRVGGDKEDKARAIAAARRMIDALAGTNETTRPVQSAALLLLGEWAGLTVKQTESMIDKASRAAASKVAKEAAKVAASDRAAALRVASIPAPEWMARIDAHMTTIRTGTDWQAKSAVHALEHDAKTTARNHKAAKRAGLADSTVAKIWAQVRYARAYLSAIKANELKLESRRYVRAAASRLRGALLDLSLGSVDVSTWEAVSKNTGILLVSPHLWPALRARLIAMRDAGDTGAGLLRAERARLAAIKNAETISEWRAGRNVPGFYMESAHGGAMVRAVDVTRDASGEIDGGTLQTSMGASVPLVHAIRAFRFVKLCKEAGRTWHKNGAQVRVGYFTLDSITAGGDFVAGCHRFAWAEIAALAVALNVWNLAPSDMAVTHS